MQISQERPESRHTPFSRQRISIITQITTHIALRQKENKQMNRMKKTRLTAKEMPHLNSEQ